MTRRRLPRWVRMLTHPPVLSLLLLLLAMLAWCGLEIALAMQAMR